MPRDALPAASAWSASLALDFERRGARTVLASKRHDGPLVVQKALHPEGEAVCHAIVVHPPAGIAGGDDLRLSVRVGEGANALLTTPGAGKWYRTAGPVARQRITIDAGAGATVEWLPQETIVYDGARAEIEWEARLAADARAIAWDVFCLGRTGSGERFGRGHCHITARVSRAGRLAWCERAHIDPGSRLMSSAAGLAGAPAFGTMMVAAPTIEDAWLEAARAATPARGESATTRLPGLLLVRYRGDSTEAARAHFTALWNRLREPVIGRAADEPRIWRT